MTDIIDVDRSVIAACDVNDIEHHERVVRDTADVKKIGGYKVGFSLALKYSLPKIVEVTREYTDKPVIYDHQKAGTDIPYTGGNFAKVCSEAGVDAVILFPQAGPETQKQWIEAAQEENLGIIGGGLMTHPKYKRSEGGYLADEALMEMYLKSAEKGVKNFVVPGNRPNDIKEIRKELKNNGGVNPVFYAPGFVAQGGEIADATEAAGKKWHAIVGRAIYQADDIEKSAKELTKDL